MTTDIDCGVPDAKARVHRESAWMAAGRWVLRFLWVPLVVLALVMTLDLVADALSDTWVRAPWRPDWLSPVRADGWYPLVLAVAMVATVRRLSGRFPSNLHWLGLLAVATLVLGGSAYWPVAQGHSPVQYVTWVLDLFTSTEAATLPRSTPAFEFARLGGVLTVLAAAVSVAMRVWRTQFDRVVVQLGLDLDVIVGANERTLALARQLVRERDDEPLAPEWRRWGARQLVSRWIAKLLSGVVLIHPNRDDPVVADFRAVGCRVLIGDPQNETIVTGVAVTGGRPAVRRFMAGAVNEADNRRLVKVLQKALEGDLSLAPVGRLHRLVTPFLRRLLAGLVPQGSLGWVPRLVAVMDDPREAREFRLAYLASRRTFVDALCPDELLARDLVAAIDQHRRSHVVLLGNGPLIPALLDEIALQGAFRNELARKAVSRATPQDALSIDKVTIVDPDAPLLRKEWERYRTPAALETDLDVTESADPWEAALEGLDQSTLAVIVTQPASPAVRGRASTINRLHPDALVFRPDDQTDGVDLTADAVSVPGRVVIGFGASLLQNGCVPEDHWTVLARQAHEVYRRANAGPQVARRPWGNARCGEDQRLPAFLREDNISQQRNVMAEAARLLQARGEGQGWESVAAADLRRTLANTDLTAIARAEHKRWADARLDTGWTWFDGVLAEPREASQLEHEWRAENKNLVAWTDGRPLGRGTGEPVPVEGLRQGNVDTVAEIVARLYLAGYAPTASAAGEPQRYRRRGKVHAEQLAEPRPWHTGRGSTLTANAGDWWVTDEHGVGRSVAAGEFEHLYAPLDAPESGFTHEKHGEVSASQCAEDTDVTTLEGVAAAHRGDWIVIDGEHRWPVPDDHFRTSYGPVVDELR